MWKARRATLERLEVGGEEAGGLEEWVGGREAILPFSPSASRQLMAARCDVTQLGSEPGRWEGGGCHGDRSQQLARSSPSPSSLPSIPCTAPLPGLQFGMRFGG